MTNHGRQDSEDLERVLMALEDDWERERDPSVVEALAKKYPDYADDLYDYFDSLLDAEIRPSATRPVDVGTVGALRRWFESEGRDLARRLATEERRNLAQERGTSTPTDSVLLPPDASSARSASHPQGAGPGHLPESLIGYLKRVARRSTAEIADELKSTPAFLRLVVADPPAVPERVKKELAGLAADRLGVPRNEVIERLTHTNSYPMAASRDQPYSGDRMTFDQILAISGLSDEQRRFWTHVAHGDRSDPDPG